MVYCSLESLFLSNILKHCQTLTCYLKLWNYNVKNVNTAFSIVTMRKVVIIFFELGVKYFSFFGINHKTLHDYLFKTCSWWKQFYILIELLEGDTLYIKKNWKNRHVIRLVSSIWNSYNIREPYLFHSNTGISDFTIMQSFDEDHFVYR